MFFALKNYFDFRSRARRKEFWYYTIFIFAILGILVFLNFIGTRSRANYVEIITIITVIYTAAIILPTIAVSIRRLHDVGRTGWWLFLFFIPVIGQIMLISFFLQDSQPGYNHWGEYPKFNGNM